MTREEFGARLRELRIEKELTQVMLANLVGVSHDTLAQWEQGRYEPTWSNIMALADALQISTELLRQPGKVTERPKRVKPAKRKPTDT